MDKLDEHYISIDNWNPLYPEKTTFLLTHLHMDHVQKIHVRFPYTIYTSRTVSELWTRDRPECVQPTLVPNQWYKTGTKHVPFRVIQLNHTIESIGFLFPTLHILYLGDSLEIPSGTMDRRASVRILYDGIFESIRIPVPTPQQSCRRIYEVLRTNCSVLRLVHHGILSFLRTCNIRFTLDETVSDLVRNTVLFLDMYDANSPYTLVGPSFRGVCIVPSSNWFLVHHMNTNDVISDGNYIRIFCTMHATDTHVQEWKRDFPYSSFQSIPWSKPIIKQA